MQCALFKRSFIDPVEEKREKAEVKPCKEGKAIPAYLQVRIQHCIQHLFNWSRPTIFAAARKLGKLSHLQYVHSYILPTHPSCLQKQMVLTFCSALGGAVTSHMTTLFIPPCSGSFLKVWQREVIPDCKLTSSAESKLPGGAHLMSTGCAVLSRIESTSVWISCIIRRRKTTCHHELWRSILLHQKHMHKLNFQV
jgi:hypothetical protein